jgi:hypothetical protein
MMRGPRARGKFAADGVQTNERQMAHARRDARLRGSAQAQPCGAERTIDALVDAVIRVAPLFVKPKAQPAVQMDRRRSP